MIRYGTILLAALSLAAGVGSFLVTHGLGNEQTSRSAGPASQPDDLLPRWLELSPQQTRLIHKHDPGFQQDAQNLNAQLRQERETLAALLQEPSTPDSQLLRQVERVIAAHDALERRVARYVVAIRHRLTAEQQKRLLGLAASSVREAAGYRWRHRWGGGRREGRGRGGGGD